MREKRRLFFKGGVQAEITGLGRERFFNIAARRELFVTGIGTDRDGHVLFWTTGEDYKKMKPAARKAGVRLFFKEKVRTSLFSFPEQKAEATGCRIHLLLPFAVRPVLFYMGHFL